jgi:hypothetical protein
MVQVQSVVDLDQIGFDQLIKDDLNDTKIKKDYFALIK